MQGQDQIARDADAPGTANATIEIASESALVGVLPPRGRRVAFAGATMVSLLLHAGALMAALDWYKQQQEGAVSQPSDAVSVELLASSTVDALRPELLAEPAPAPDATAPVKGSSRPSEASAAKSEPLPTHEVAAAVSEATPNAKDKENRAPERGEAAEDPVPTVLTDAPADVVREPFKAAAVVDEDAQAKRSEAKQTEKKKAARRVLEGGTTSKATAGTGTGSSRVSASTGSILTYAALVRARVAGNRPSGGTAGSSAHVAFGLTPSGGQAYVRIARSSGNAANDSIALAAVRGAAPFPPPPAGATAHQLQFDIHYYFQ